MLNCAVTGSGIAQASLAQSSDEVKQTFLNEAMDHFRQLEQLGGMEPKDQVTMASCEFQLNKKTEAIARLAELVGFEPKTGTFDMQQAKAPGEIAAYVRLAEFCNQQGDTTAASQTSGIPQLVMDQMIQANPASSDAYIERAMFLRRKEDDPDRKAKALNDAKKALEVDPKSERAILAAAQLSLEMDDLAAAQSLLESGVQQHPDSLGMYMLLASTAEGQDDLKRAKAYVQQGLEQLKLSGQLLFQRANYEIDLKEINEARQTLARLEQQLGPSRYASPHLDMLRGRLLMADGNFAAAAPTLETAQQRLGGSLERKIELDLLECYRRTGTTASVSAITATDATTARQHRSGRMGICPTARRPGKTHGSRRGL